MMSTNDVSLLEKEMLSLLVKNYQLILFYNPMLVCSVR